MDLFKGRNLSGRLARWYLTIEAYNPEINYIKGKTNVVADALSCNIPVGAVTDSTTITNFNIEELYAVTTTIRYSWSFTEFQISDMVYLPFG